MGIGYEPYDPLTQPAGSPLIVNRFESIQRELILVIVEGNPKLADGSAEFGSLRWEDQVRILEKVLRLVYSSTRRDMLTFYERKKMNAFGGRGMGFFLL